jgi:hypothetical protein
MHELYERDRLVFDINERENEQDINDVDDGNDVNTASEWEEGVNTQTERRVLANVKMNGKTTNGRGSRKITTKKVESSKITTKITTEKDRNKKKDGNYGEKDGSGKQDSGKKDSASSGSDQASDQAKKDSSAVTKVSDKFNSNAASDNNSIPRIHQRGSPSHESIHHDVHSRKRDSNTTKLGSLLEMYEDIGVEVREE